jgi:DNA repair exonuclease SbcCD ATPase subunit
MYKLSKIELDNFRVFKGHRTFDLLNRTGKPYNFICIYGPNGSGKTSLVDALEWLATGKLHRIDSDMQVQGKTYEGAILTHIEAYNDDQRAKVAACFINSNGDSLQYRRSIRPRRDSINDYLSGYDTGRGLSSTQILPYSRVAGFVSAEKPEQRFTSWAGFIEPEDQSFSLLTNTYRLRSKIKSMLDKRKEELDNIITDLTKCNLNEDLVLVLNNAILSYNEAYRKILPQENSIVPLRQNKLGIYLIPDMSGIKALQLRVSAELEHHRAREPIIRQLIDRYPEYHKADDELVSINELEKIYQEKIEKSRQKKEFDTLKRDVNSLYDTLLYLLKECIADANEQIRLSIEQKEKVENEQKIWQQQLEQIEKETTCLKESDPNPAYQDVLDRQKMLQSGLWNLTRISNAIESQQFEVTSTYATTLPQECRQEIIEKIGDLTMQDNAIQNIIKQRAQISLQIQEAESSCSEIIASIEQIRAQIINTQLKVCPVCQAEFASTESLLARIKQEFCSKGLAEARAEYYTKDVLLKSLRDTYKSMVQSCDSIIQKTSKDLEREISSLNKETEEISDKVEQFNRGISLLDERRKMLKTQLSTTMNFTAKLTLDVFDALIKNTYQRLNESHLQKEFMLTQLSKLSERLHTVMLCLSGEITDAQQQLETALHLLSSQSEKVNTLKAFAQEYMSQIDKLIAIRELLPDISEVNLDDMQTYNTKVNELDQIRITLINVIDRYQKLLYNAQLPQNTTIDQINHQYASDQEIKYTINTKILPSLINILSHETELLAYQKQYQNLFQQKGEHEENVEGARRALERIDNLYNSMCSIQQKVVDQAFSGEMVNKLYRMLEPNKDFPRLSFKIDFNSVERPELYIKAHEGETDDCLVLPELIFSSAQLNTISLCIFLSNVLSNSRLDSQTLILDDPISSFDDINTVAFSDLLRILCVQNDWQIFFTTHDEKLFRLLQVKLSPVHHNSIFMQFKAKGQLVDIGHTV